MGSLKSSGSRCRRTKPCLLERAVGVRSAQRATKTTIPKTTTKTSKTRANPPMETSHSHLFALSRFLVTLGTCTLVLLLLGTLTSPALGGATPQLQFQQQQQQLQQLKQMQQHYHPQNQQRLMPTQLLQQTNQPSGLAAASQQQQQQSANAAAATNNPYTNATHMLLLDLRRQLIDKALKFDEHFRGLLSQSKLSLHNMFLDTYGMIYLRNTEIFTSMYESLEQYYATGKPKLTSSMESFFERLYQKIFLVYNANRLFPPGYLECATEQLAQLKPFKDAPDKLIGDIRHAFVAARTFTQALNSGIDIIKSIISLGQPAQCTNLINDKLLPKTSAISGAGSRALPCLGFCEQVISRCIGRSNLEPLNERWRLYVASLAELAKKLSVQYNIETVIGPIDVQISEAIMNFQENAPNITAQVLHACGRATPVQEGAQVGPGLAPVRPVGNNRLSKRAAAPGFGSGSTTLVVAGSQATGARGRGPSPSAAATHNQHHQQLTPASSSAGRTQHQQPDEFPAVRPVNQQQPLGLVQASQQPPGQSPALLGRTSGVNSGPVAASSLSKKSPLVINEVRDFVISTKGFWSALPTSVCTSNYTLGQSVQGGANLLRKAPSCFQEPLTLSDMNLDLRYRLEVQQQLGRLDQINRKINEALNGIEIDWSTGLSSGSDSKQQQQQQPLIPGTNANHAASQQPTISSATAPAPESSDQVDDEESEEVHEDDVSEDGSTTEEPEEEEDEEEDYATNKPDDEADSDEEAELPTTGTGDSEQVAGSPPTNLQPQQPQSPQSESSEETTFNNLENNDIENQRPKIDLNLSNELITASDQSPQRSSASSIKLVIQNQVQLLFVLFLASFLSVVNINTHSNQITLKP